MESHRYYISTQYRGPSTRFSCAVGKEGMMTFLCAFTTPEALDQVGSQSASRHRATCSFLPYLGPDWHLPTSHSTPPTPLLKRHRVRHQAVQRTQ